MVAEHGWALLPDYRFDATTGLWRHRNGPVEPPLRLSQLSYDADGVLRYPHHEDRAPESALRTYLVERAPAVRVPSRRVRGPAGTRSGRHGRLRAPAVVRAARRLPQRLTCRRSDTE